MRNYENSKRLTFFLSLFCILLGFSLLNGYFIGLYNSSTEKSENESNINNIKSSNSWNLNYIHIDGSNWEAAEGNAWLQGNGSLHNPYLIENVTIDATGSPTGSGILIENSVDIYFIIRNCTVSNAGNEFDDAGIKLLNTNKGRIINCDCSNNGGAGIYLGNSSRNTISGNTADNNNNKDSQGAGINLDQNSNNNTVYNNHVFNNNRDGIILYRSSDWNNISHNKCSYNGRVGIMLLNSANNNTIEHNKVTENICDQYTDAGIHIENSDGNHILYNNLSNNENSGSDGISLLYADYNEIIENTANKNARHGFYLSGSNSNKIHYNTAKDNGGYGICLYSSSNNNDIIYYNRSVDDIYISGDSTGNNVEELILEGPKFSNLVEITDPLEYGDMVTIRINVTDPDGVDTTLIETSGVNYTMTNIIGDIWEYSWTPSSLGLKPYTIWANDSLNYWYSFSDSVTVQDTTPPNLFDLYESSPSVEAGEELTIRVNVTDLDAIDTVLFEILGKNNTMTNIGEDIWEFNWTSTSGGSVPYIIWASDSSNNWNSTSDSVNVQDMTKPNLSNLYEDSDPAELGQPFQVQINATDAGGIDSVLFEIIETNYTMTNIEGEIWEYNWTATTLGTVSYTIWANDSSNNWNSTSDSVTIQDTIGPSLSNLDEDSDPAEFGQLFQVQVNVTDPGGIDSVLFEISGINYTMTNIEGEIWEYNWMATSIGIFSYTIWANDSNNNWNFTSDSVTVEDTTAPNLFDLYENNPSIELGDDLTIQVNATDFGGVTTVLFEILGQNNTMTNIGGDTWEFKWTSTSVGSVPYTIWANDTSNNWNSTSDSVNVQDTTGPDLSNLYEDSEPVELGQPFQVQINATDLGGVDTVLFGILGINYTMTNMGGDTWEYNWTSTLLGTVSYTIWANDTSNNWNSTSDSVNVQDTTGPDLSDLYESSDSLEIGEKFQVQINATDAGGIDSVLFEITGINYTMTNIGGDTWEYNWTSTTFGSISYTIWSNDSNNNWNFTSDSVTVEDTTPPNLFDLYESRASLEAGDLLTIQINATDLGGIDTVLFGILEQNYTMTNIEGDMWEYNWTSTSEGTISYTIWANDSSDNWNSLSDSVLVEDTIAPLLFNLVESADPLQVGNNLTIRINITDNGGIDTVLFEILNENNTMTNIGGDLWEYNWHSNTTGIFLYTIWVRDINNNWNFISRNITVQYFTRDGGGIPSDDEPTNPNPIIIIIIIIIGSALAVSGYAFNTRKQKKSAQESAPLKDISAKKRAKLIETRTAMQTKKEAHPAKLKHKKKQSVKQAPKPLTPEEKGELEKTEKEMAVNKQKFFCVVHRGPIYGNKIYLCKHCNTFYCERCAKVLKIKGDQCWSCGNEIEIEITEEDKRELAISKTTDLIDEIYQEKEFLNEYINSDLDIEQFPLVKEQLFSLITEEEKKKIDSLDLSPEEKKDFLQEFLNLDKEERKKYLDDMLHQ